LFDFFFGLICFWLGVLGDEKVAKDGLGLLLLAGKKLRM